MDRTLVIGEALVDIVRRPDHFTTEFVGGSHEVRTLNQWT